MNVSYAVKKIDWMLLLCSLPITLAGLVTMYNFGDTHTFFNKQILFLGISLVLFFISSTIDLQSLKKNNSIFYLYIFFLVLLLVLFLVGKTTNGAQSWFHSVLFLFNQVIL